MWLRISNGRSDRDGPEYIMTGDWELIRADKVELEDECLQEASLLLT